MFPVIRVLEVHDKVTGGLDDPGRGGMWCRAEDPDSALRVFDHGQHIHAGAGERDGFEEVTGQQDLSLGPEELHPGAATLMPRTSSSP
jgi:hypothetical protein